LLDAQSSAPEAAKTATDFILDVYRIERAARDADLLGTPEHLEMRQTQRRRVMDDFKARLVAEAGPPPAARAARRIDRVRARELGRADAVPRRSAPPHRQQRIGRALRASALGRKNLLFVGTDEAGENLAGLYSLIATCEANGANPVAYPADVLRRVQTHLASRIEELLPQNWKPPEAQPSA
jgi:transposase